MTAQQDQLVRIIEKKLDELEDTCVRAEEIQQVMRTQGDVEVLKTLLKERE
jgi:hypothetical protein